MPGAVTLSSMETRVRRRADMVNSGFVSSDEVRDYISESMGTLIDMVLESDPDGNYMGEVEMSTVAGTSRYVVADGSYVPRIYKVLGVFVQFSGEYHKIRPATVRSQLHHSNGWTAAPGVRYFFNIDMDASADANEEAYIQTTGATNQEILPSIKFTPTPQAVHTFKVQYVPFPLTWSDHDDSVASGAGTTIFQGLTGWDEWVVIDAAAKCLEKEESDTSRLELRKQQLMERIMHHAQNRDVSSPDTIHDIEEDEEFRLWDYLPRP